MDSTVDFYHLCSCLFLFVCIRPCLSLSVFAWPCLCCNVPHLSLANGQWPMTNGQWPMASGHPYFPSVRPCRSIAKSVCCSCPWLSWAVPAWPCLSLFTSDHYLPFLLGVFVWPCSSLLSLSNFSYPVAVPGQPSQYLAILGRLWLFKAVCVRKCE